MGSATRTMAACLAAAMGSNSPEPQPVNECDHFARVLQVITKELSITGEIRQDTTLQSLRLDSLDRVMLAVALEDEFGVTIPGEREEIWTDIDSICQMLDDLVPA